LSEEETENLNTPKTKQNSKGSPELDGITGKLYQMCKELTSVLHHILQKTRGENNSQFIL
jgi:hypothetical protein